MKRVRLNLMRFLTTFFLIFGVVQFMFLIRNFIPPYNLGGTIAINHSVVSFVAALIFTTTHTVISSEALDRKITVKARMLLCSIPCAGVCGYLALNFGLQSWLRNIADQTTAIIVWIASFALSLIAFLWVFFMIEKHNHAAGKEYDVALAAYKQKTGGIQNEADCHEDTENL